MSATQSKFVTLRSELSSYLIERDGEVDVVMVSLISRENPLLIGEPGTAKTLLIDSLVEAIGGRRFVIIFNKFTVPEEVMGPVSVAGLKEDKYRRITTGKLPEADFAYGDEVFKASSAILNTLLRILNERVYDNGDGVLSKVPLKVFLASSNEWPQSENGGQELAALFDRFLFRKAVKTIVTAAGKRRLWWEKPSKFSPSVRISPADIDTAYEEAAGIDWSDDGKAAFEQVMKELNKEGIFPGDRRQRKAIFAAQAFSYLCGSTTVEPDHMEILASVLWSDPQEQPQKCEQIIARIANPASMKINSTLLEVEQILAGLDPADLKSAATGTKKLQECAKQLGSMHDHPRAKKAAEYVKGEVRRIHLASMGSL